MTKFLNISKDNTLGGSSASDEVVSSQKAVKEYCDSKVGSTTWGNITGTLSNQTDLNNALNAKANDSDVVKTSGNQTIAGDKTFTNPIKYNGSTPLSYDSIHSSATKGTTPSTNAIAAFSFLDSTFSNSYVSTISRTQYGYDTSGNTYAKLQAFKPTASSTQAGTIAIYYPSSGNPYATAPTPTEDTTSSTQIDTVGARNTKLAGYVDTSTDQTIAGNKTFTGYIKGENISNTNHAMKLGASGANHMDLYEYGGLWNFYKSRSGTNTLVGKIAELTTSTNDETLATTNWVNNKGYALDSDVGKLASDNTWTGNNTISSSDRPIINLQNTSITKGTTPSDFKGFDINFYDGQGTANANRIGLIECGYKTDDVTYTNLYAYKPTSGSTTNTYIGIFYNSSGNPDTHAPASDTVDSIVTTTGITKDSNGYVKLGNGIIIQWGSETVSSTNYSVTLPTAFSSTNYKVVVSKFESADASTGFGTQTYTTTKFNIKASTTGKKVTWIAIGY